ncbi:MAG: alkaline phosphatase D family protein [Acidimicrobiia bacterium]
MTRRRFLQGSAAAGLTILSAKYLQGDQPLEGFARLAPSAQALRFSANPVNQGAASTWDGWNNLIITSRICPPNEDWGQIVPGKIRVFELNSGEEVASEEVTAIAQNDFRVRVRFPDLDPRKEYTYEVSAPHLSSEKFVGFTKPPTLRRNTPYLNEPITKIRIAVISCMEYTTGFWNSLDFASRRGLDAVFVNGDSIYADTEETIFTSNRPRKDPTPIANDYELFLMKYLVYNDEHRKKLLGEVPVFGVPDDHEIRNNIVGTDRSEARMISDGFKAYSRVYASADGAEHTGFYRRVDFGEGVRVLMLDTRMFRDKDSGTMLGEKQLRWFLDELKNAKSDDIKRLLVVTSVSFSSGLDRIEDSWAGFTRERQHIVDEIARLGLTNVNFISGDLHTFYTSPIHLDPLNKRTEVVAHEFEVGALSSRVRHTGHVNDRVSAYTKESHGYMELTVDTVTGDLECEWFLYDATKRDYIPQSGARFLSRSQGQYSSPDLSYISIEPDLVANPGGLERMLR